MNPNIAIIIDYTGFSEENNLGGSETWAVEISKQFVRNNYNVFLFTRNPALVVIRCSIYSYK